MVSQVQERREAVAEIFLIFAEFFKYPTKDFFEEISTGIMDRELTNLYEKAYYLLETPNFQGQVNSYKEYKFNFSKCFLGITKPYAAPIESVYKVWTTDPTARVPIANSKGYVMGDSAIHIQHLFQHFQLEIPEEYKMMPDHLTILLELYAFLVQRRSFEDCQMFLKDHFDWLEDFQQSLSQIGGSEFFLAVVENLQKIISQERRLNFN